MNKSRFVHCFNFSLAIVHSGFHYLGLLRSDERRFFSSMSYNTQTQLCHEEGADTNQGAAGSGEW